MHLSGNQQFQHRPARVAPDEAHAELIVDADAVLTGSVTFKRFEPVTRRGAQKIQCLSSVELGHRSKQQACPVFHVPERHQRNLPQAFY